LHVEFSDATAYSPSNTLTAAPIAYFYNNTSADAAVATTIRLDAGNLTGNNAVSLSAVRTGNADAAMTFGTRSGGGSVTERARITSSGELLINTTSDAGDYKLQVAGNIYNTGSAVLAATSGNVGVNTASPVMPFQLNNFGGFDGNGNQLIIRNNVYYNNTNARSEPIRNGYQTQIEMENLDGKIRFSTSSASNNVGTAASLVERMRITNNGEVWINTTSDAGDYKLQVAGNIYNTGSAVLAATSGEAYIGTTSDAGNYKLQVSGQAFIRNTATSGALYLDSTSLSIYEVKNRHAILISGHSLTGAEIQGPIYVGTNWNTSSDVSAIEVALTNTASGANSNLMKLSDGTNTFRVTKDAGIFTAAPSGGTARKWKLGSVVATTVILDTANYVEVEINGVAYKLALATPN
jgi:hypothetical protein